MGAENVIQANTTFRVFISCTFDGPKAERGAVRDEVFRRLKALCGPSGSSGLSGLGEREYLFGCCRRANCAEHMRINRFVAKLRKWDRPR